jgi:hypothetical protein
MGEVKCKLENIDTNNINKIVQLKRKLMLY